MVSVLLPVHDGAASVARAVRSVLAQDWRALELIAVDDGSTDGSAAAIRAAARGDARVRILRHPRARGITGALNRGLAVARGAFIARIDHDDVWIRRGKLAAQVARLRADPGLVLVGTAARFTDEGGRITRRRSYPAADAVIRAGMFAQNPFVHSSVVFRRAALARTGPYPARPLHVEDLHLWLKLGRVGRFAILPAPMVRITERPGSISATHAVAQQAGLLALIWAFRRVYPGAGPALLRHGARFVVAGLRRALPGRPRRVPA